MVRVVYFISSHINPDQVTRLVRTLKCGSSSSKIVIHHDFSKSCLKAKNFHGIEDVYLLEHFIPAMWGDFSLVRIALYAMEWIETHLKYDWIFFLSGQDYPIKPLPDIANELEVTDLDGIISGVPLCQAIPCGEEECSVSKSSGQPCPDCISRYYYQYFQILTSKRIFQLLKRKVPKVGSRVQIKRSTAFPKNKFLIGFKPFRPLFTDRFMCFKGSQWFALNKKCIEYILLYLKRNPNYIKYYRRTVVPDESFFQTLLFNNPNLKLSNDNKRFIKWNDSQSGSPNTLQLKDYDEIIESGKYFARKFDIRTDAKILDMIDEYLGHYRIP